MIFGTTLSQAITRSDIIRVIGQHFGNNRDTMETWLCPALETGADGKWHARSSSPHQENLLARVSEADRFVLQAVMKDATLLDDALVPSWERPGPTSWLSKTKLQVKAFLRNLF